ncbi:hypothetical protein [Streptomyces sp. CA-111067]|uniref:hypothetical protein n=1 Tax=Streptomyces sp. CA-111067 TaxID=3240046 RepID=UPI003D95A4BC
MNDVSQSETSAPDTIRAGDARRAPVRVPYVTRWSGEKDLDVPVVVRRGGRGVGFAHERAFDRELGVLWTRTVSEPGRGRPEFGKVHSLRQRLAMGGLRCQICGGPADRNRDGVLWLLDADAHELRRGDELTAHPPVCVPCAHQSVRGCPHLRPAWVAVRVRSYALWGVLGVRYSSLGPEPVAVDTAQVRFGDPHLRWVRAHQLIASLGDFTVTDL